MFIEEMESGTMYMVCDGHLGVDAAAFVERLLPRTLVPLLPKAHPNWSSRRGALGMHGNTPLHHAPCEASSFRSRAEVEAYARSIQKALCTTFVHVENEWLGMGHMAGTTVTILLVTGSLLTSANVGDSAAVLDTGCSILELTDSHRIQTHVQEKARLEKAGCNIAQLGFHLEVRYG